MTALPAVVSATLMISAAALPVYAAETATAAVSVSVQVASRTSLRVSSDVLHFDVLQPGGLATAAIDFSAGARVPRGADLVLTVEPHRTLESGGGADVESSVTFEGEGDGTVSGALDDSVPAVAGRWQGSGLRLGRLRFTLHCAGSGDYILPVRFVLSTP